ncbi:Sex-determining transformer protein 1 [Hypsizygus marmoreus]|uniref:Sex-determining transformer protein 1 n=1 Tax=Hypsizygus marmoreus TaxID=39966 RepID=A0A369JH80_HYPMA|nr:Sex-determining transformer protein 1 [Hypsizygus marmoreus]
MTSTWTCETCHKTFSRKGDLTRHIHLHTGYKPHKCSDCGKSFSQFSGLKTHRNVHSKLKPFACGIDGCKAAFGDPSSRARHCKETHRTLGAYRCPYPDCKSSIKRRSAFTLHLRKHGINPVSIDVDGLAPPMLPKQASARRRSLSQQVFEVVPTEILQGVTYSNGVAYLTHHPNANFNYQMGPQIAEHPTNSYLNDNWYPTPTIQLPALPTAGLYAIDSDPSSRPSSPPELTYSATPSPAPSRHELLRTPDNTNERTFGSSSSPSTPPPMLPLPGLFSGTDLSFGQSQKQLMSPWDIDATIFGLSSFA